MMKIASLLALPALVSAFGGAPGMSRVLMAKFPSGSIYFTETVGEGHVTIKVDAPLADTAYVGWHVHSTSMMMPGMCGSDSTGGHFNPLMRDTSDKAAYNAACAKDPLACEEGDLSGKFGIMKKLEYPFVYYDPNLHIFDMGNGEEYSIAGRSIVMHADDGSRVACADLVEQPL